MKTGNCQKILYFMDFTGIQKFKIFFLYKNPCRHEIKTLLFSETLLQQIHISIDVLLR